MFFKFCFSIACCLNAENTMSFDILTSKYISHTQLRCLLFIDSLIISMYVIVPNFTATLLSASFFFNYFSHGRSALFRGFHLVFYLDVYYILATVQLMVKQTPLWSAGIIWTLPCHVQLSPEYYDITHKSTDWLRKEFF